MAIDVNTLQKRGTKGEELFYPSPRFWVTAKASRFPEQIRVEEVTPHFPTCTKLRPSVTHTSLFVALDEKGSILGQVGRTSPHADSIVGYQGPVDSLLILETNGTLKAMTIRSSFENQPYVDYPNDDAYFSSLFQGRSIGQLADMNLTSEQVAGVSGATMTSMAMAEGIVKTAQQWEQLERVRPYTGWAKDMHYNGQIKGLAQFKDGKRDGLLISYNKDGTESSRTTYKDGEQVD